MGLLNSGFLKYNETRAPVFPDNERESLENISPEASILLLRKNTLKHSLPHLWA
jgi:hypothetical protein